MPSRHWRLKFDFWRNNSHSYILNTIYTAFIGKRAYGQNVEVHSGTSQAFNMELFMNIVNGIKSSTSFAKLPLRYFERFLNTSLQYAYGLLNSHVTRVSIKSFHLCLKSLIRRRRRGRRQIKSVYAEFKYGFYSRAINVFIASRKFSQKLLCLFLNFINRIN